MIAEVRLRCMRRATAYKIHCTLTLLREFREKRFDAVRGLGTGRARGL
jgi:2-methylcitrate dehydratase PrpD